MEEVSFKPVEVAHWLMNVEREIKLDRTEVSVLRWICRLT